MGANHTLKAFHVGREIGKRLDALVAGLTQNHTLTSVRLRNLDTDPCSAIAALGQNTLLGRLELWGASSLADEGAQCLAATFDTRTLVHLDLGACRIGDMGACSIAKLLGNNGVGLKTLVLWRNKISDEGARCLAAALQNNSTLTSLNLRSNRLGDGAAEAFACVLALNCPLQFLSMVLKSPPFFA